MATTDHVPRPVKRQARVIRLAGTHHTHTHSLLIFRTFDNHRKTPTSDDLDVSSVKEQVGSLLHCLLVNLLARK
jgi:hypothetical protein